MVRLLRSSIRSLLAILVDLNRSQLLKSNRSLNRLRHRLINSDLNNNLTVGSLRSKGLLTLTQNSLTISLRNQLRLKSVFLTRNQTLIRHRIVNLRTSNNLSCTIRKVSIRRNLRLTRLRPVGARRRRLWNYVSIRSSRRLIRFISSRLINGLRRRLFGGLLFGRGRLRRLGGLFRTRILTVIVRQTRLVYWDNRLGTRIGIVVGMHNSDIRICRLLRNLNRRVFYKLRNINGAFNLIARKCRKLFVRSGKRRECLLIILLDSTSRPALRVSRRVQEHQQIDVIVSSRLAVTPGSCRFHLPREIDYSVVIGLVELKLRRFLLFVLFPRIERGFGVRLNTPSPAHIVTLISAVVEPRSCRLTRPNKQTPAIVRGEMLRVRFFLLLLVTKRSVRHKIGWLRSLRSHSRNGDHGRNYRNGSQHCGKDHPPLSGDVS